MGEQFDSKWEYYVGNEEVEEIIYGKKAKYLVDEISDWRLEKYKLAGIRFGRGSPDKFLGRLAPDPDKRKMPQQSIDPRICKGCGNLFNPRKKELMHCGDGCYKRKGRARELPESIDCVVCGVSFRPDESTRKVCSIACGVKLPRKRYVKKIDESKFIQMWQEGCTKEEIMKELNITYGHVGKVVKRLKLQIRTVKKSDDELFSRMWLEGKSRQEIALALGMSTGTIRSVRKRLGLPARPVGNHSRKVVV